jgi:20S proteasome subunit alpha 6
MTHFSCLLEGDNPFQPLTFYFLFQGHDLIVDAVEQHSPRVDGQNGQEHPHKSSGKESNGSAEVGPNGTAPAVVDGPVPPLNGTNVSPDAIATKSAEGVAPAASAAAAAAAAVSAAANELISSVLTANPAPSSEEQATNDTGYAETQAAYPTMGGNSLQPSVSLASTIVDLDSQTQDTGLFEEDGEATAINPDPSSLDKPTVCDSEAEVDSLEQEHLPEPPASPTSNTLLSTSSGSTYGGEPSSQNVSASSPPSPMKTDAKAMKTPSANRLSISYAAGSRRLVVDAGVVEELRVFRADGRVEAIINVERDSEKGLKGILVCPVLFKNYYYTNSYLL